MNVKALLFFKWSFNFIIHIKFAPCHIIHIIVVSSGLYNSHYSGLWVVSVFTAHTSLRADTILWSKGTKQEVLLELTVPWEERMEEAHKSKLKKYQALIFESQLNGWKFWNLSSFARIEVMSVYSTVGLVQSTVLPVLHGVRPYTDYITCPPPALSFCFFFFFIKSI